MNAPHIPPLRPSLFGLAAFLALTSTPLLAQAGGGSETVFHWEGGTEDRTFGFSSANAGDFDGDSVDDIIIGASGSAPSGMVVAGSVYVYSGVDGSELFHWDGPVAWHGLGSAVASAGDVNGDGIEDVLVGARAADPGGMQSAGCAYLYSGMTGALLFQWNGTSANDHLGCSVSSAGDLNLDGYLDVLVGADYSSPGGLSFSGSIFAYSGFDGSELFRIDGTKLWAEAGSEVESIEDVNADGIPDILSGGNRFAAIYSGADGSMIHDLNLGNWGSNFGQAVAVIGDVNQDGMKDVAVGAHREIRFGVRNVGSVRVFSGMDGSLLYRISGNHKNDRFGHSISGVEDQNGDGTPDFVVGAIQQNLFGPEASGRVGLYSGVDGSLLQGWSGVEAGSEFGYYVSKMSDLNQDGRAEILVGAPSRTIAGTGSVGTVDVLSFDPYATISSSTVSASGGGTVFLDIDFPITSALMEYRTLLSAHGTVPTQFGIAIPLTRDAIMEQSYLGNYPVASSTNLQGTLDAFGDGVASFTVAPGQPAGLVGNTIWVAVISNPVGQQPAISSIAMPVTVTP
ncbi:MAG: integrin alpha [Planctomycetota bacterium]